MELTQLHYFVMVAETGNITKAAEKLYITQPALSRVILRLEKELGTPLFDRKGGRVTLNRHGEVFLRHVKPALASINEGVHAVIDELGNKQVIIHNYLTADLFRSIVEKCQAEFDTIEFSVKNFGDNVGDADLEEEMPSLIMLPANEFHSYVFPASYMERWCVIYNNKYEFHTKLQGNAISLRQLSQEPIVFSGSRYDREFLDSLFDSAGLTPRIIPCESLGESSVQINRRKAVGLVPAINFRSLIRSIDSIPIAAAMVSDHPCTRKVYLGRSPKFLANVDDYTVLDSIINHLSNEYAETDAFFDSYFGLDA